MQSRLKRKEKAQRINKPYADERGSGVERPTGARLGQGQSLLALCCPQATLSHLKFHHGHGVRPQNKGVWPQKNLRHVSPGNAAAAGCQSPARLMPILLLKAIVA